MKSLSMLVVGSSSMACINIELAMECWHKPVKEINITLDMLPQIVCIYTQIALKLQNKLSYF